MLIVGGGLAGLAAATALGSQGFDVDLHEARPFLGGRATSFPLHPGDSDSERIDNCQHVLLRCFTNLMDFYRRCGTQDKIRFHDRFYFVRPGGAMDILKAGLLPAPFHLFGSFMGFGGLRSSDKWSILRGLFAMRRAGMAGNSDSLTIQEWLASHGATENAIQKFWRPILVSALNEEPRRASARWAFQVFLEGLMGDRSSYQMGVPTAPLAELYPAALDKKLGAGVQIHLRSSIERIDPADQQADFYLIAVPFERVKPLLPGLDLPLERFEHSPITGIHLWFDRPITHLPHAVLLDRTLQWVFRKSEMYFQAVVSASRDLLPLGREEIVELALRELGEFFAEARTARLVKAHVVKEARATFAPAPGLQAFRLGPETPLRNVFLAGDWTDTNWPPTMEGAVRSGYRAAEAVANAAGIEASFLIE